MSQVNTPLKKERSNSVKTIQTHPYKYTIGSCLFDSTIFCLSKSKNFEVMRRYINGPELRASLYTWAITTLTNDGNHTLTDMESEYIYKKLEKQKYKE